MTKKGHSDNYWTLRARRKYRTVRHRSRMANGEVGGTNRSDLHYFSTGGLGHKFYNSKNGQFTKTKWQKQQTFG